MTLSAFRLPSRASRDLGFDEVKRILLDACRTPFGARALEYDWFPATLEKLETRLAETLEAKALAELKVPPDFAAVQDLLPVLDLIEKGGVLGPHDVRGVARTLDGVARIRALIESRADEFARLAEMAGALSDDREWCRRVMRAFDESGALTDDASAALKELRDRVRGFRASAREVLKDIIRGYDDTPILQERNFTIRNDRFVLPVKAEHQRHVEGIVHDASQTGSTVFIEPRSMMQLGNRIKIAQAAVLEEEQRVLVEMTGEIASREAQIRRDLDGVGELEAAYARGVFSAGIGGVPATVSDGADDIRFEDARHPLLAWRRHLAEVAGTPPPEIVGNDISFGGKRALVITGPNAGGKTVALTTAGLLTILGRSGLLVPAAPGARMPLFAAVVATLGDEQSLASDLSSFSGHLETLARILQEVEAHPGGGPVLCLLDELASGTDPSQGAAIAQAVLEALVERGALVIATTHYERLKTLAVLDEEHGRFRNASVALDPDTHKPTFQLRLDQVGTSDALQAAQRHGLPAVVIERAKALLDPAEREVQTMLTRLAEKNAALERAHEGLQRQQRELESRNQRLTERLDEVRVESERLRREGAAAFLGDLKQVRRKVADAIEAIQRGADARELDEVSHQLLEEQRQLEERAKAPPPPENETRVVDVAVGDEVELVSMSGVKLTVLEVDGDAVELARGAMRMRKPLRDLRAPKSRTQKPSSSGKPPARPKLDEPRTSDNTIDLRGRRVEDAREVLEAFMDSLLRAGKTRAFVLHGHGTGALKRAVREGLSGRYAARARPAADDDGGDAFTVLDLDG